MMDYRVEIQNKILISINEIPFIYKTRDKSTEFYTGLCEKSTRFKIVLKFFTEK